MSSYIQSLNPKQYDWISYPFMETSSDFRITLIEEEELSYISSDRGLMIKHMELSLEAFWISIRECYVPLYK